jgi:hypothetical protein
MLLFAIVMVSLIWMHVSIVLMDRKLHPEWSGPQDLPEIVNAVAEDAERSQ